MDTPALPININQAILQHENYVKILRDRVGVNTVEIDADDEYPDCVFIEDTAVVISNVAVVNKIGAKSREGEVDAVKDVLRGLGVEIFDMREDGNGATLDGGDVLYPVTYDKDESTGTYDIPKGGNHLFVGLSSRTNLKGVDYLAQKFQNVEVIPVDIAKMESSLHLKSIVSHIDEKTILVPKGAIGDKISRRMDLKNLGYDIIRLNDLSACNVVRVNNHLLIPPTKCEETRQTLEKEAKERNLDLITIDASEFAKVDGALTCKSILI